MTTEEMDAVVARQTWRMNLRDSEVGVLSLKCVAQFCREAPLEWFWLFIEGLIVENGTDEIRNLRLGTK